MSIFIVFIISLGLLSFLFVRKGIEVSSGRKTFLTDSFYRCDHWTQKILSKIYSWWSHINFKNLKLIFSWIIGSIKKLIISIKRRFDHKQSQFFSKQEDDIPRSNGKASFFLKDVSDYKKSLREGKEE